jgi:hypothetical protein
MPYLFRVDKYTRTRQGESDVDGWRRRGKIPGGTKTFPPGALTSTRGGGVECDAPMICYATR